MSVSFFESVLSALSGSEHFKALLHYGSNAFLFEYADHESTDTAFFSSWVLSLSEKL